MSRGKPVLGPGGRPKVRIYTPQETDDFENLVAFHALRAFNANPWWNDLALSETRFWGHIDFFVRSETFDGDNAEKAIWDGVTRANEYHPHPTQRVRGKPKMIFARGIWRDDRRIRAGFWAVHVEPHAAYRTEVTIETAMLHLDKPAWMAKALAEGWTPPRAAERTG